jgi:hypothetical protein
MEHPPCAGRLNLERTELGREKEVVRKFLPVGPEMEADVVTLKEQLEAARAEVRAATSLGGWRRRPALSVRPAGRL